MVDYTFFLNPNATHGERLKKLLHYYHKDLSYDPNMLKYYASKNLDSII